jgi:hypothetical protein
MLLRSGSNSSRQQCFRASAELVYQLVPGLRDGGLVIAGSARAKLQIERIEQIGSLLAHALEIADRADHGGVLVDRVDDLLAKRERLIGVIDRRAEILQLRLAGCRAKSRDRRRVQR